MINLPTPSTLNYWWNFGSLLILNLVIQIFTGLFLSLQYSPNVKEAFENLIFFRNDTYLGWLLRFTHSTGASFFFIFCYLHIFKAFFYDSFYFFYMWFSGVVILLILIIEAFLGYVLPWGQISFWGASVITNLISATPLIGQSLVEWVWGRFRVRNVTLNRFYSFHFILPFILLILILLHIIILHVRGSSNPLGLNLNLDKIIFSNYYVIKDLVTVFIFLFFLFFLRLFNPFLFIDPENFIPSNPLITPIHIQPEWYFLFAYAILRSIPRKLGGVLLLIFSIFIVVTLPLSTVKFHKTNRFNLLNSYFLAFHLGRFLILTWLGMKPVEDPFLRTRQLYTTIYFGFYLIYPRVRFLFVKAAKW